MLLFNKCWVFVAVILFIKKVNANSVPGQLSGVLALTANFFTNLNESLQTENEILTDSVKEIIDSKIHNYIDLVKQVHGISEKHVISKRNLGTNVEDYLYKDSQGVYIFKGFSEEGHIETHFPIDLILFTHSNGHEDSCYAAVLEAKDPSETTASSLIIFKEEQHTISIEGPLEYVMPLLLSNRTRPPLYLIIKSGFTKILELNITNAVRVQYFQKHGRTYLVIGQHYSESDPTSQGTAVYELDFNEQISRVQTLNTAYPTDLIIWNYMNEVFLAVAHEIKHSFNGITDETDVSIYRWMNKHFDKTDSVQALNPKKLVAFKIGNDQFLAVANHKNDYEEIEIFSEIFKYDVHDDQFVSYQKIATHAAVDIKFFGFEQNKQYEYFLVIANLYELANGGIKQYETNSFVYKFVDGYFMPFQTFTLNAVSEWLPVQGHNGEFLLLASCKFDGLKIFQYDGWNFIESDIQIASESCGPEISSMHMYYSGNDLIVSVTNKRDDGHMSNLFLPHFEYENSINNFQDDIEKWCATTTQAIDFEKLQDLSDTIQDTLSGHNIQNAKATFKRTALNEDSEESIFNELQSELHKYNNELDEYLELMENVMIDFGTYDIDGSAYFEELTLECGEKSCSFDNIDVNFLNDVDIKDFMENVIDINNGFSTDGSAVFDAVMLDGPLSFEYINGHPVENIIKAIDDTIIDEPVVVDGNVYFQKGLFVDGLIDDVKFQDDSIILKEGDQLLTGSLHAESVSINNLNSDTLSTLEFDIETKDKTVDIQFTEDIQEITVDNLILRGHLNKVNIEELYNFALRNSGDQNIIAEYRIEELSVDAFDSTNFISGKQIPEKIDPSEDKSTVMFNDDVEIKNLIVMKKLNHINVDKKLKLDVLLKNTTKKQYIRGSKSFESVDLLGPLNLQGKIGSTLFEKLNPVSVIDNALNIESDIIINGDVSFEQKLNCRDIRQSNGKHSFKRLFDDGLHLNTTDIPVNMALLHPTYVNHLYTDSINGISPSDLVVMGTDQLQYITGTKTFPSDLTITDGSVVININGVDLAKLDGSILKTKGNQAISGIKSFNNITAARINSSKIYVGQTLTENIIQNKKDEHIDGTVILNSPYVEAKKSLHVKNLQVQKEIIGSDLGDALTHGSDDYVTGTKTFTKNVTVSELNIQDSISSYDINRLTTAMNQLKNNVYINQSIVFREPIIVENMHFVGYLNGISSDDFGSNLLTYDEEQIIENDQYFDSVDVDDLQVLSGLINDNFFNEIAETALRIDREENIENVLFINGLSTEEVSTDGLINGFEWSEEVILVNSDSGQHLGHKKIANDIIIDGNLVVDGLVSGVDFRKIYGFVFPREDDVPVNLKIEGSALFEEQPEIALIDDIKLSELYQDAWFADRNTELHGFFGFENAFFEDVIDLKGNLNGYDLSELENNYFSKTKNQAVTGQYTFTNITSYGNILAEEANVTGLVSNINLQEFSKNVLLQNVDQNITKRVMFEDVLTADKISVYGSINGYENLKEEVMCYDVPQNTVFGTKNIKNVKTDNLRVQSGIKIKNVDIVNWMNNSFSKYDNSNVQNLKTFNNVTFLKNIMLEGFLNGNIFDELHILTSSTPKQKITGKKTFKLSEKNLTQDESVFFESLKTKKLINNVDISKLLKNQVYVDKNIVINSPKTFTSPVTIDNITVDGSIFGVDISSLTDTNIDQFKDLHDEYNNLFSYSKKIVTSLKEQAYFLSHYKVLQTFESSFKNIIALELCPTVGSHLAISHCRDNLSNINFYKWNKKTRKFVVDRNVKQITTRAPFTYTSLVRFGKREMIYAESLKKDLFSTSQYRNMRLNDKFFSHIANIYGVTKNGSITVEQQIPTNGTQNILSLNLPENNRSCLLIISNSSSISTLYCENDNKLDLYVYQTFERNGQQATSVTIGNVPFIIMVNNPLTSQEPTVDVWRFNDETKLFEVYQIIHVASPISADVIEYNSNYYLAIASGLLQNALHPGLIKILIFDKVQNLFIVWHHLTPSAPTSVQFSMLPSKELVLYVLTDSPTEPLIVYKYEGIAGFTRRVTASIIPRGVKMIPFNLGDSEHFVVIYSNSQARIIQAFFKGNKI